MSALDLSESEGSNDPIHSVGVILNSNISQVCLQKPHRSYDYDARLSQSHSLGFLVWCGRTCFLLVLR